MKQNVFKKVLPYKMRNAAMALAATVAGMTTTSCEKDDVEPEIIPTEVYNYHFYPTTEDGLIEEGRGGVKNDIKIIRDIDHLKGLVNDQTTKEVNLISVGDFRVLDAESLTITRKFLEERMNLSSKIKGQGAINTKPGVASQVPADSAALAGFGYIVGYHAR